MLLLLMTLCSYEKIAAAGHTAVGHAMMNGGLEEAAGFNLLVCTHHAVQFYNVHRTL